MRSWLCIVGVLLLVACSPTSLVVRQVAAPEKSGSVVPLSGLIQHIENGTIVVFVHGVGDHCPGFALDSDVGWLNDDTAALMGIAPDVPAQSAEDVLWRRDPAHGGGPRVDDDPSWFAIGHRSYSVRSDSTKKVLAVELTWSGLTQWLKVKQLGFDLTKSIMPTSAGIPTAGKKKESDLLTCIKPYRATFDQPRVALNRALKEDVFDRSLADALIYIGSNGSKINQAMSETLCRALTGDFSQRDCSWSAAAQSIEAKPRSFVFVTHSLGSRITYDTLLEMAGKQLRTGAGQLLPGDPAVPSTDPDDTSKRAVALGIAQDSSAAYMMANQLPLLGLVNILPTYTDAAPTQPFLLHSTTVFSADAARREKTDNAPQWVAQAAQARAKEGPITMLDADANIDDIDCRAYSLLCFAQLIAAKKDAVRRRGDFGLQAAEQPAAVPFHVVAFSDTNDLLTWALPPPYADPSVYYLMDFTNVFVQNSPHWIGVIENPADAHSGYFTNPIVQRVIACGADGNRLREPCK